MLPSEDVVKEESRAKSDEPLKSRFHRAAKTILSPAMLLLLIGGSIRQSAGATWSYNAQLYFQQYYPNFNPGLAISLSTLFLPGLLLSPPARPCSRLITWLQNVYISFVAPSSQPRNVQLTPKSSTQLEITWEAPTLVDWNSEHLSYKVGYKYGRLS